MIKNETRESAHLKSRVKDLSVVPNLVSFTGLFTAITPIAKLEKNPDTGCYDPILIRDTDSLIANFGDPRIDPEKYIDLYSIMQVVGNGTSCYVAKVDSGPTGIYEFVLVEEKNVIDEANIAADLDNIKQSSISPANPDNQRVYKVGGLHNEYSIIKIIAHPSQDAKASAETSKTVDSTTYTITYTAVDNGSELNGHKVSIHAKDGAPSVYVVDLKDENGASTTYDIDTSGETPSLPSDAKITLSGWASAAGPIDEVQLHGGSSADPDQRDWELDNVATNFENDTTAGHEGEKILTVSVLGDRAPGSITIQSAELDPEYGREKFGQETPTSQLDDVLRQHTDTGEKDPYHGKTVYESRWLNRKYNIIDIKDGTTTISHDNYTVAWDSKDGKYILRVVFESGAAPAGTVTIGAVAREDKAIIAYSSMAEPLEIKYTLTQAKPYSLKLFYLNVDAVSNGNKLGSAKVKLEKTTTNQQLINNINSSLQTYARFELVDQSTRTACEVNDLSNHSIVKSLLDEYAPYEDGQRANLANTGNPQTLTTPSVLSRPDFKVTLQDYINAQELYKDRKYVGCLMADFAAPVTHLMDGVTAMVDGKHVMPLDPEERRSLHYYLKQIACERKDATVILSTPFTKGHTDPYTLFTKDEICDWVASQGDYADLWEYGSGNTTDYSIQSFYLEIYYSWLNMQCTKIENGLAKSVKVKIPPSNVVVNNILTSWRERGVQYPVAGDQGGTLPDTCTILQNPKTKLDRDQLVQYRINPIWDTGTRGIQIYGNETLNAGYTDLNAAHIARTLVYIRSRVDEYTETLKFLINSRVLWDTWKAYVTSRILEPLQSANALSSFRVSMGEDTTSREEIANRMIKGNVELTFYQSAEIFDLSFIVYSSATTVDEANPL